jgi:hypothetical protein
MTRQDLRPVLGNVSKLALKGVCDVGVQRASPLAQQGVVSGVLYKRMFEQVSRVWGYALAEQQTSCNDTVECCMKLCLRLVDYRRQQCM